MPSRQYEIRYNVIVTDSQGNDRWVSVVVRADTSWTVSEIEDEAVRIADELADLDSGTGGRVREGYDGPRLIQVGGIVAA